MCISSSTRTYFLLILTTVFTQTHPPTLHLRYLSDQGLHISCDLIFILYQNIISYHIKSYHIISHIIIASQFHDTQRSNLNTNPFMMGAWAFLHQKSQAHQETLFTSNSPTHTHTLPVGSGLRTIMNRASLTGSCR